jgi:hypothetical protein
LAALLKGRADMSAKTKNGWSPLFVAAHHGHRSAVRFLGEDNPADLRHVTEFGTSALLAALSGRMTGAVEYLLAQGAPVKHQDRAKQTPVMYAARQDFDLRAAMVHAAEQEELRRRALKKFGRPAPSRRHSSAPMGFSRRGSGFLVVTKAPKYGPGAPRRRGSQKRSSALRMSIVDIDAELDFSGAARAGHRASAPELGRQRLIQDHG